MDSLFSIIVIFAVFISIFSKVKKAKQIQDYRRTKGQQDKVPTVSIPSSVTRQVTTTSQSQKPDPKFVQEKHAGYDLSGNKMERMQSSGNLIIAKRLYEGDMTPKGYREKLCGYCGASNLLPTYSNDKYACYFCHEKL